MDKKIDLFFIFKYVQIFVRVDSSFYNHEDEEELTRIVSQLSKEIHIDKSYVSFKKSKYRKTFITEKGWKQLLRLIIRTNFGKNANIDEKNIMHESYKAIILQYIYHCLVDYGYDISNIHLDLDEKSRFIIEIYKDTIKDNYKGLWQYWH